MVVGLFQLARGGSGAGAVDQAAGAAGVRTGCDVVASAWVVAELWRTSDEAPTPWLWVRLACPEDAGFKRVSIEKTPESFVLTLLDLGVAMDGVCIVLMLCMLTPGTKHFTGQSRPDQSSPRG